MHSSYDYKILFVKIIILLFRGKRISLEPV